MKNLIIISGLFFPVTLLSQRPATGAWLNLQLPFQINNKWQLHNEGGYRTLGNFTSALQYLYRTGIRYNVNKNWSTAAGVAFFFTRTNYSKQNNEFAKEFRLWEEANFKNQLIKKLHYQIRLRIEQRSFAVTSSKSSYYAFRYRIKPQLQQIITDKWSILIADEYMQQYAHSNWSFDQNRLIANAVYQVNKFTQFQAGYMWLRWPARSSQNIVMLSFQKTISLHDKQQ